MRSRLAVFVTALLLAVAAPLGAAPERSAAAAAGDERPTADGGQREADAGDAQPASEPPAEPQPAPAAAPPHDVLTLRFLGPFRTRDLTPTSLLRLDLPPAHGVRGPPGAWALEVGYSHANTFVMSDTVRRYLAERGSRRPLEDDDVEALLARDGDIFYFDAEVGWIALTAHYGITDRLQVYGTMPLQYYRGGWFDGSIESFHDALGFSTASRDLVARHRVQILQRVGDDVVVVLEPPHDFGFGDPILGSRFHFLPSGPWDLVGEVAVKVPLASVEGYLSSGHADLGMQLSAQRVFARDALYLSAAWIHLGGNDFFPRSDPHGVPTVSFAWEHLLTERTSTVLQITGSRSAYPASPVSELAEDKYLVSLGVRRRRGQQTMSFAVTENVANFNNSPDIGIHVGYAIAMLGPDPGIYLGSRPGPG